MSGGMFIPRAVRYWPDRVTVYDLGNGREPRTFLKLDIDEQAFVVARIGWRESQAAPTTPTAAPAGKSSKTARARAAGRRGGRSR